MKPAELRVLLIAVFSLVVFALAARESPRWVPEPAHKRREVVFWHFWGGRDRAVVDQIVDRFNASQSQHVVRAVAMPGNNLDLKFFLGVAGGNPPDVVNQDDPIVADWAARGALVPLDELASAVEVQRLRRWLYPAARELAEYRGRLFAMPNGLDIRALYYDRAVLDRFGLDPPRTLEELDRAAFTITPPDKQVQPRRYGFLPDPRRIWAWGIVFGGRFYDPARGRVTCDDEPIVAALEWMTSYSRRYGADNVVRFRKGDQALTGSSFPLLEGRYAMIMDGQWRIPELLVAEQAALRRDKPPPRWGVVPLPAPTGGRSGAGWANGNRFVVPRGARNAEGAWALMKFWSGFGGHEAEAARACAAGGWIPVSQNVVRQPTFKAYLERTPQFRTFVELAASPHQVPTPAVPGATFFQDEVIRAAEDAMYGVVEPRAALRRARARIEEHMRELKQ